MDISSADTLPPQPELLTNAEIIRILINRCLTEHKLRNMARPELLELYYKLVMPLEQRVNQENLRGKALNLKRGIGQVGSSQPQESAAEKALNGVKKIKLTAETGKPVLKRPRENQAKEASPLPTKKVRQRICWP